MSFFDWLRGNGKPKPDQGSSVPGAPLPDDVAESFDQMDDAMEAAEEGPKRPLLYMFQYVALPEAAFENHPELKRELEG